MPGCRLPSLLGIHRQQVDEEKQQQCQTVTGTPTQTQKGHCQDLNEQRLWSKTKRIRVWLLSDLRGGSRLGNFRAEQFHSLKTFWIRSAGAARPRVCWRAQAARSP
jgi:hypothetical protein